MEALPPGKLLTLKEVATALDLSERAVQRLVKEGHLAHPVMLGSSPRWFETDVRVYLWMLLRAQIAPAQPPAGDDAD